MSFASELFMYLLQAVKDRITRHTSLYDLLGLTIALRFGGAFRSVRPRRGLECSF